MSKQFYIHDARIEPEINTITISGKRHKIEPKIMQVLMCLVEAKGEVVTKQYLLNTVWVNTIVVEMVLTRAISELRSVFGDKPTKARYIETISKSGYRLIAPVSFVNPKALSRRFPKIVSPVAVFILVIIMAVGFLLPDPPPPLSSKPLTSDKGWEYHPSISHDGTTVAYIGQTGNAYSDIFLHSIETDSVVKLTESNAFYLKPVWSPNGTSIAAFRRSKNSQSLYIFSANDKTVIDSIPVKTQFVGLSWSPDGQELSYVAYDSTSTRHSIYQYSFENASTALQIETSPESWGDAQPRYSPDGKSLAFVRTVAEGNQDLYRLDLATSTLHRMTQINRNILGFAWESEGYIVMSSDVDGNHNLWKLRVDDAPASLEKVMKVAYGESIQNPTIHDGLLVGECWMQDTDLIMGTLEGGSVTDSLAITSTRWELHPDISPDGGSIVFSSNRSGFYEIWSFDREKDALRQLTNIENGFSGKPKWSPDGDQITFESNATGRHQIYTMNANGENFRQFTEVDSDHINPSWSRDGSAIYSASNIDGNWSIWSQALLNGHRRKVSGPEGYFLQESTKDLGRTFITKLHQQGIWEIKADGTEVIVVQGLQPSDWGSWSVQDDGIYFINRTTKKISFYDFDTEEVSDIMSLQGNLPPHDPAFSLSRKAGFFLYGKMNSYSGDLVALRNY